MQVSQECASAHILSLLATSLVNNSGLILTCVKIANVLVVVKRLENQQFKAVKSHLFQSVANLSIYQSTHFSQKTHFRICSLNKYIFKIAPSKNTFQKNFFQINCSFKKYNFKIAPFILFLKIGLLFFNFSVIKFYTRFLFFFIIIIIIIFLIYKFLLF